MDDLFNRQMPHSLEAEQAVLGSILIDGRCAPQVISVLKPEDFYTDLNRGIYETICSMFNFAKPIDAVTVLDEMKLWGIFNAQTSQSYLVELMSVTPTAANVMRYVEIIRDKALLRNIATVASDITAAVNEGTGSSGDVLETAEQKIYALRQGKTLGGLEPISTILGEVYQELTEISRTKGGLPGLPTGLGELDDTIMGLKNTDFLILASRPGMGKTSLALNIALNVGKKTGKAVAIFSLEMSKQQLALRLLSGEAFVDSKKLQTGLLSREDWQKLSGATAAISRTKLYIDDNSVITVSDMKAQCRRLQDLGLVVIDYLQLMTSATGENSENRLQAVSEISRMMKIMAKELNVPVLCLSQLSRASAQRQDKRPQLSDLRESGSLEQDADIVLGLYREDYFNKEAEDHNQAELIVMKNRHGNTGTIQVQWIPEYTTYTSVERVHTEG
ncbi:MAG: replicative DNA helicase [Oscillospiraceae bacterium]|nr:replicative DNA helicase [Oscillospiraceae bacterium]